jgi:hypothetical protein
MAAARLVCRLVLADGARAHGQQRLERFCARQYWLGLREYKS